MRKRICNFFHLLLCVSIFLVPLFAIFLSMVIKFAIFLMRPFTVTPSYFLDLCKLDISILKKSEKCDSGLSQDLNWDLRTQKRQIVVKVAIVLDVFQDKNLIVFIIFELCYIRKKCVLLWYNIYCRKDRMVNWNSHT